MSLNLKGKRFGKLVAVKCVGRVGKSRHLSWLCKCDCGREKVVLGSSLIRGDTKSCGCLSWRHGDSGHKGRSRLSRIWRNMRERCEKEYSSSYKWYGARGIRYCEEWGDYVKFKEWAIHNGYREDLTLDRIDVDGNYCPENCRWITYFEQARNRTNSHYVEYNGRKMIASDLAKELGVSFSAIVEREKRGLPLDEPIKYIPPKKEKPKKERARREKYAKIFTWNGESKSLKDWMDEQGLESKTFENRRYKKCLPAPVALKLISYTEYKKLQEGIK